MHRLAESEPTQAALTATMHRRMFRYKLFIIVNLMILPVVAAPPARPPQPVETTTAQRGALKTHIQASGSLSSNEAVMIRPEIAGRVAVIHFTEGGWVEKGTVLFTLDQNELRARAAESEAQLQLAKVNLDRATELLKKSLISQQQYDETFAKHNVAQAQVTVDQERLKKTVLRAPFSGYIGLRKVSPGDYVQPGQDLVEVVDTRTIKVDFHVPEIYLAQLRPGLAVTLHSDAYPNKTFNGKIYAVAPEASVTSRSVAVRARIDNHDKLLRGGLFAQVEIILQSRNDVLLIPEQALWPIGNQQNVYKVVDGKAQLTPVTIGQRHNGSVEIRDGIQDGDQIITAGQMKIMPGAAVMPLSAPPAKSTGTP